MLGLLKAEWRKVTRYYLAASFLVWIFPIGLTVWFAGLVIISVVSNTIPRSMLEVNSSGLWTLDMVAVWGFVTSFPLNVLGRMLPVAFMAVVFGGEYQWGTWRTIVPRSHRSALIAAKLLTSSVIVALAFVATSIIAVIGNALSYEIVDLPYPPTLTLSVALESMQAYLGQALLGFLSLLLLADFAALAAVLTRSLLGSLVAGIFFAAVEPTTLLLLAAFGRLIDQPGIASAYQITPTYHISNAQSWLQQGQAVAPPFSGIAAEPALVTSLLVVVGWVVALAAVAMLAFRRQDLTS